MGGLLQWRTNIELVSRWGDHAWQWPASVQIKFGDLCECVVTCSTWKNREKSKLFLNVTFKITYSKYIFSYHCLIHHASLRTTYTWHLLCASCFILFFHCMILCSLKNVTLKNASLSETLLVHRFFRTKEFYPFLSSCHRSVKSNFQFALRFIRFRYCFVFIFFVAAFSRASEYRNEFI